ncbi:MAG: hypothetical protein KIG81_10350 [Thermoguttaceae bacterium]|nr:hypothetical protein [Thermoguttaceae bacterium]
MVLNSSMVPQPEYRIPPPTEMTLSLENSVSALTSASNLSGEDSDEPPYFILQLLEFSNMMDAPHEG